MMRIMIPRALNAPLSWIDPVMGAHTPGPWSRGGTFANTVFGADGSVIATATQHRHGEQRALANARLIAAAPDGLAVASDICAILDGQCAHDGETLVYDDYHKIGEEVAQLHEKLTAYIAKARGQDAPEPCTQTHTTKKKGE